MIIAIDPGVNGGIAVKPDGDGAVRIYEMPDTLEGIDGWFRFELMTNILKNDPEKLTGVWCYLEKVHSMPKQRPTAVWTFAENYGALKGIIKAYDIPRIDVEPKTWQKAIGATREAVPKGATPTVKERIKREAKKKIKSIVEAKYPYLAVSLKTADALGILMYAEQENKNGK